MSVLQPASLKLLEMRNDTAEELLSFALSHVNTAYLAKNIGMFTVPLCV